MLVIQILIWYKPAVIHIHIYIVYRSRFILLCGMYGTTLTKISVAVQLRDLNNQMIDQQITFGYLQDTCACSKCCMCISRFIYAAIKANMQILGNKVLLQKMRMRMPMLRKCNWQKHELVAMTKWAIYWLGPSLLPQNAVRQLAISAAAINAAVATALLSLLTNCASVNWQMCHQSGHKWQQLQSGLPAFLQFQ